MIPPFPTFPPAVLKGTNFSISLPTLATFFLCRWVFVLFWWIFFCSFACFFVDRNLRVDVTCGGLENSSPKSYNVLWGLRTRPHSPCLSCFVLRAPRPHNPFASPMVSPLPWPFPLPGCPPRRYLCGSVLHLLARWGPNVNLSETPLGPPYLEPQPAP